MLLARPAASRAPLPEVARSGLAAHARPGLVLPEGQIRALLAAAARASGPASGGLRLIVSPTGIALEAEDDPRAGPVGAVSRVYGTPAAHFVMVTRVVVTALGAHRGETPDSVLGRVLGLADLTAPAGSGGTVPAGPPPDPFRRRRLVRDRG